MKKGAIVLLCLGSVLVGCAAQDHIYRDGVCITCINNPLTGQPVNYDPDETPQMTDEARARMEQRQGVVSEETKARVANQSGVIELVSPMDVDLVYARLRSEFRMRSPADFTSKYSDQWAKHDGAFHHEVTPGTYYKISDYSRHVMNGVEYRMVFKAELMRDRSGTLVKINYFPSGVNDYNGDDFKKSLKARIDRLLK